MKLKAWDNHEKRWAKTHEIEGELFINPEVGDTGVFYIHDHSASGKLHYTFIHPTGLLDRHGKEIWEGDKVIHTSFPNLAEPVVFHSGAFWVKQILLSTYHSSVVEVIGNIFEVGSH